MTLPPALEGVSWWGWGSLLASSPLCSQLACRGQGTRMPLPRNAKMLSTKQPRAGKVGPAAENANPEKVSPKLGKRRGGLLWGRCPLLPSPF